MKLLTGSQLGKTLCDAFGIQAKDVTSISVNCAAGGAAEVSVCYLVRADGEVKLTEELRRYILVEANNGH